MKGGKGRGSSPCTGSLHIHISMKHIRHSVFETNSSSTHSITIGSSTELNELPSVDEHGVVHVQYGEYGWEYETYRDVQSRMSYAATWAREYGKQEHTKMLVDVIKKYTHCKAVKFDDCDYYYIDHQSSDVAEEAFKDEETLARFLFNKDSSFHTDNDNH